MLGLMLKNIGVEEVEEAVFSCIDRNDRHSEYDKKANLYDRIIGNALYNRLAWGNRPSHYAAFCHQALASSPGGIFLDAGCGSLTFTANAYASANNQLIVLLDRSIGMLRKGKQKIQRLRGGIPRNIVFLQGDIFNLPFQQAVFDTVAAFGVLHLFERKIDLLMELERVKQRSGQVFFSSLVGNNLFGRQYLKILKTAGEVASCHSSQSLRDLLSLSPFQYQLSTIGNMAYGRST